MLSSWQRRARLGILAGAALFGHAGEASACSKFCQDAPIRLFPQTAEIPGNLVYFKVLVDDPGSLTLTTAKGERLRASVRRIAGDRVFAPDQPVPAGVELVVHYQQRCLGKILEQTQAFKTASPAEPMLRPAESQIVEEGTRYPGDTRNESRFYRVRYYSPDAASGVTHLLETVATIDGKVLDFAETYPQQPLVFVEARCAGETATEWGVDSCGGLRFVPLGERTLVITSHVVGSQAPVNPVTTRLSFDCSASRLRAAPAPSGPALALSSAPPSPRVGSPTARRTSRFGCQFDAKDSPSFLAALLGPAALALFSLRRDGARERNGAAR